MAYDVARDQYPLFYARPDAISPPLRCYLATAAAAELPVYSKALAIYVPEGVVGTVTMVYRDDPDGSPVTRKFGPGNHTVVARIRRITAITGAGVEVHVETD